MRSINFNLNIYDYSKGNLINYENKYNLNKNILNLLEPNYNYIIEPISKNINIGVYVRFCNDDFKDKYLCNLKTRNMAGLWRDRRLEFVKRCKIFINIHAADDFKICETHRVYELIAVRCIVVSQRCDYEKDITLYKYIIFEDDDKIVDKVNDILENYDDYYNKIYGNITNKEIFKDIDIQWNNLIP